MVQLSQGDTDGLQCRSVSAGVIDLLRWKLQFLEQRILDKDLTKLIAVTDFWTSYCLTAYALSSDQLFHLWALADLLLVNESIAFRDPAVFSRLVFSA